MDWLKVLITVLGTGLVNFAFFYFFQKDHQKQLETLKVVFSGVYKERVDIYKNLLENIYDLEIKVERYSIYGDDEKRTAAQEIFKSIADYKRLYNINEVYLSSTMIKNLRKYDDQISIIFKGFYKYYISRDKINDMDPQTQKEFGDGFSTALKELTKTRILEDIKNRIIEEMRAHLGTIKTK